MEYDLDINDIKQLKKLGYDKNIYYCGNYSMQKFYTYIYNQLQRVGVKFAFNRACFIHDYRYSKKPNIYQKVKIDYEFYCNMHKCITHHEQNKDITSEHAWKLRCVAMLFYTIVVIFTPFYMFQ